MLGNACSGVIENDFNLRRAILYLSGYRNRQRAAVSHGLKAVFDKIEEHLFDFSPVGPDMPDVGRNIQQDGNVVLFGVICDKPD